MTEFSIFDYLNCDEFFIAEQVGIPSLYAGLWQFSDGPTEDDHVWHTFHELRQADAEEITCEPWGSVSELIARFKSVNQWDEQLSPNWNI